MIEENRPLLNWFYHYTNYYKNNLFIMKSNLKINKMFKNLRENPKYKDIMLYDEDKRKQNWLNKLEEIKEFKKNHDRIPQFYHNPKNNDEIYEYSLSGWIGNQNTNYDNNQYIMIYKDIGDIWNKFVIDNNIVKKDTEYHKNKFYDNLNKVKDILRNNPDNLSKEELGLGCNDGPGLGRWLHTIIVNYNKRRKLMVYDDIYNEFKEFINNPIYINYFISSQIPELRIRHWTLTFEKVKEIIKSTGKNICEDTHKYEYGWIGNQKQNYRKTIGLVSENI
jgi:hypothetical protein